MSSADKPLWPQKAAKNLICRVRDVRDLAVMLLLESGAVSLSWRQAWNTSVSGAILLKQVVVS